MHACITLEQVFACYVDSSETRLRLREGAVPGAGPFPRRPCFRDLHPWDGDDSSLVDISLPFYRLWRRVFHLFNRANAREIDMCIEPEGPPTLHEDGRGVDAFLLGWACRCVEAEIGRLQLEPSKRASLLAMLANLRQPRGVPLPQHDQATAYISAREQFDDALVRVTPEATTACQLALATLYSRTTVAHVVRYRSRFYDYAVKAMKQDSGVRRQFCELLSGTVATRGQPGKRAAESDISLNPIGPAKEARTSEEDATMEMVADWHAELAAQDEAEADAAERECEAANAEGEAEALELEAAAAELEAEAAAFIDVDAGCADDDPAVKEEPADEIDSEEDAPLPPPPPVPHTEWEELFDLLMRRLTNAGGKEVMRRISSITGSDKAESSVTLRGRLKSAQVREANKDSPVTLRPARGDLRLFPREALFALLKMVAQYKPSEFMNVSKPVLRELLKASISSDAELSTFLKGDSKSLTLNGASQPELKDGLVAALVASDGSSFPRVDELKHESFLAPGTLGGTSSSGKPTE